MRLFISISLTVFLFFQMTANLWILASFQANRDYIAQNLCVNRTQKGSTCKGACYLKKKLNDDNHRQHGNPELKCPEFQMLTSESLWQERPVPVADEEEDYGIRTTPGSVRDYYASVFKPPPASLFS